MSVESAMGTTIKGNIHEPNGFYATHNLHSNKNGTYKVSITCEPDEDEDFDPYTISMDITIKKDKITEISNITANTSSTNKAYTNDAKKGMVSKIVANGNADGVNTVAGATCSSKAIKDACQKAFNAAKK